MPESTPRIIPSETIPTEAIILQRGKENTVSYTNIDQIIIAMQYYLVHDNIIWRIQAVKKGEKK